MRAPPPALDWLLEFSLFFRLLVVSTKVGGIPEVLPPHMIRLAPVSASGLATTLANAVEEIRQQRIHWSEEGVLTRAVSLESWVDGGAQPAPRPRSQSPRARGIRSGIGLGCPRVQRTLPPAWPPASAFELAWQRHREIRQFYSWDDVARRTEVAYRAAMSRPRINAKEGAIV